MNGLGLPGIFKGRTKDEDIAMRRILLFSCFLLTLAGQAEQRYHLVRVVATGSTRYSQEDVARATGLTANSQVTMEDLQQGANRLGNSGAFSSVQFQYKPVTGPRDSVEADFQVKDAEKFFPAVFENFVWLSDPELQQALHDSVPLYNGALPASGSLADDLKAALSRLLSAKALPSDVSYIMFAEIGQLPSAYKFKVDNANLKIRDFRFSGADHLAPELLAQAVAQGKGRDYLRSDTEKLLNLALLPLYRERGYLEATFGETRLALENGAVLVTVSVNEGEQYRLAGFSWAGNTLISSGDLSKSITLKTGEIVNAAKLNRDLVQARKLLLKFGREAATVTAVPSFAADTVTYTFQVKEGDQYYMGRLEIEGFDAETTRKLTESWKLAPGAPYDNTYLQQFLVRTLALTHGRQTDWLIFEQPDDAEKIVNVRLQHN
ncbi:MAG TPA: POTRA domain-containing protein [Candidatus Angelobacter sp.]